MQLECEEGADPLAADLFRLCAFLHADAIPEELLVEGMMTRYEASLTVVAASDLFLLDATIKALHKFSLLQRNAETKMFSIHRLVQSVIRDAMDEGTQRN